MKPVSNLIVVIVLGLTVSACKSEPRLSPNATYMKYYDLVIKGRSFDEDVTYHSKARRQEVIEKANKTAASSGQTLEGFQNLYLTFTQKLASCGELSLEQETETGDKAQLVYAVKDVCTTAPSQNTLHIVMVYEDGWKIQSDVYKSKLN